MEKTSCCASSSGTSNDEILIEAYEAAPLAKGVVSFYRYVKTMKRGTYYAGKAFCDGYGRDSDWQIEADIREK